MATPVTKRIRDDDDNDSISYYGSIAGDTFASRRRKNTCDLRQQSIHSLAKRLRNQSFDDTQSTGELCEHKMASKRPRFNKVFHHYRFIVAIMGGVSVGLMFLLRYSISVSILRMVNQTHLYLEEHPNKTIEDFIETGHALGGEFNWNNEIQAMIMSWYMVAYTLPQVASTRLGIMMGSRLAMPISLGLCGLSVVLTPMFAYFGWQYVIFLRLVNGLGASAVLPMLLNTVESWMRYDEISLGLSLAQIAISTTNALTPLTAGYLSAIHWSISFTIPGFFALGFSALWPILVSDRPADNYFVSARELDYLCTCDEQKKEAATVDKKPPLQQQGNGTAINNNKGKSNTSEDMEQDVKPDSWTQVFKVPSFYAYIIMWSCYCSSFSGFSFILPNYLRQFLNVKVAQNGMFCSLIQSGAILAVIWPHPLLKTLDRFGFSATASRRIAHWVLNTAVVSSWVYVGIFHEHQLLLFFLNRCFHSANDIIVTGCLMSNYAKAGLSSLVFSMVNTIGNLSVVFSSTFMGWLLDYTGQSRAGWTMIFCGLGVSQLITVLLFNTAVRAGPIKFKNKPKKSVDRDLEQNNTGDNLPLERKSDSILNNFDKLRNNNNNNTNESVAHKDKTDTSATEVIATDKQDSNTNTNTNTNTTT